ncbi:MAG: glycosyltransferase family 39 protein [Planctomycetaceae bacterium]|nr:glycosyltransferase family 39 protein [Planctomycetaceae bacterium]
MRQAEPDDASVKAVGGSFFREAQRRPVWWPVIVCLLAIHATLAILTARYCTVTHDEYWHIPVGRLNLQQQRFDYDNLNPPLGRMLAGLPLLILANDAPAPQEPYDDIWRYGDEFQAANPDNYHTLIFAARLPGIVLSVVFAVVAACWSARLFGFAGGLATLTLWSLSPSMISMAALATNDALVSGLFLLSLSMSWRLGTTFRWKTALAAGVCTGLASLIKFTGLLLFALTPLTTLLVAGLVTPAASRHWSRQWAGQCISLALALLTINAGYLFQGSAQPVGDFAFESQACQKIQALSPTSSFPVPLPADFLAGVDHQRAMMESEHPVYLDGEWSRTGFRSYFFWVLAWKLPHALQLLLLLSLCCAVRMRGAPARHRRRTVLILLLPAALLLSIGSLSSMQLGLRYVLPAMPGLFVMCGLLFAPDNGRFRKTQWLACVCLSVTVLSLRYHPQHITYFNELAGGPQWGWRLLSDSNVDWGQDLRAFAEYYQAHPEIDDLKLAYFGTFPPGRLGISYRLPPREPEPGWYALSLNLLQGRPNPVRKADDSVEHLFDDPYSYMRYFEPVARIGGSIHVFHITEAEIIQRRIDLETVRFGL